MRQIQGYVITVDVPEGQRMFFGRERARGEFYSCLFQNRLAAFQTPEQAEGAVFVLQLQYQDAEVHVRRLRMQVAEDRNEEALLKSSGRWVIVHDPGPEEPITIFGSNYISDNPPPETVTETGGEGITSHRQASQMVASLRAQHDSNANIALASWDLQGVR